MMSRPSSLDFSDFFEKKKSDHRQSLQFSEQNSLEALQIFRKIRFQKPWVPDPLFCQRKRRNFHFAEIVFPYILTFPKRFSG